MADYARARGLMQGGLALLVVGGLYLGAARYGLPPDRLRTLSFFALIAAIVALILANRSFSTSLGEALQRQNTTFRYVLAFVVTGSALILTVPQIQHVLKFTPLGPAELGLVAMTGAQG